MTWIPVSERLPEHAVTVRVRDASGAEKEAHCDTRTGYFYEETPGAKWGADVGGVVEWRPMRVCGMIAGVCRDTGAEKQCGRPADVLAFGFPACNSCVAACRAEEVIRDSDIEPLPPPPEPPEEPKP